MRMRTQYRVTWVRQGAPIPADPGYPDWDNRTEKSKTFGSLGRAERHVRLLTHSEPWRDWAPEKGPDDYVCCDDPYHCETGSAGLTMRQECDQKRAALPPIVSLRIDKRIVTSTPWELAPGSSFIVTAASESAS